MGYYNSNIYKYLISTIEYANKYTEGVLYNELGREGEKCVVRILNEMGLNVKLAKNKNQPDYDACIYHENNELYGIIQIKTDTDGNLKCKCMTHKQIKNLMHYEHPITKKCLEPILINYYPYHNDTMIAHNFLRSKWFISVNRKNFIEYKPN